MQVTDATARSLVMDQPTSAVENSSKGGLFHGLRCVFYRYDALDGTRANMIPCTLAVAGAAATGAVVCDAIAQRLPDETPERIGTSLMERTIYLLEGTVKNNPMLCGAAVLGAGTIAGLHILGSSLKPLAKEGIEVVREGVRHQLERSIHSIANFHAVITHNNTRLSQLEPHLVFEKSQYQRASYEQYQRDMSCYYREADLKAGDLKGYVDGIFSRRREENNERAGSQTEPSDYRAGGALSLFIAKRDYSSIAKYQLLKSLEPSLTPMEFEQVQQRLDKFPWKPVRSDLKGPYTTSYEKIKTENASELRKVGVLEAKVKEMLVKYPILTPDKEGKIPKPDVDTFKHYLPD